MLVAALGAGHPQSAIDLFWRSFPNLLLSPLAHFILSQAYLDLEMETIRPGHGGRRQPAHLLCLPVASNRYVFPTADVHCRLDVLRKLKTPKLEQYYTFARQIQRRRFAKLATAVLAGIENKVFIPQPSWMCSDCPYQEKCRKW